MKSQAYIKLELNFFLPNINIAFAFSKEIQVRSLEKKITFAQWMLWSACRALTWWEPLEPLTVNYPNQRLARALPGSWPQFHSMTLKHRTAGADVMKTHLDLEVLNFHKGNHVTQNDKRTCTVFLTWAMHQEKKKQTTKHANTTMTGSLCNECSPFCSNSAGRN